MKKLFCLCWVVLALWVGSVAFAEPIQPLYLEADRVSVTLIIDSNGTATCRGTVTAKHNNTTTDITLSLKKSLDGKTWSNVKSWNDSGSGLLGASIEETYTVSEGYQYKVTVTGKIYSSSGNLLESVNKTSPVNTY